MESDLSESLLTSHVYEPWWTIDKLLPTSQIWGDKVKSQGRHNLK